MRRFHGLSWHRSSFQFEIQDFGYAAGDLVAMTRPPVRHDERCWPLRVDLLLTCKFIDFHYLVFDTAHDFLLLWLDLQ